MTNRDVMEFDDGSAEKKLRKSVLTTILVFVLVVVLAIVSATLVKRYRTTTFYVDGSSMWPTLDGGNPVVQTENGALYEDDGDKVILWTQPNLKRGDIVVFRIDSRANPLIKRVIGLAGDTIVINGTSVSVNGEQLDETYINGSMDTGDMKNYQTVLVPEGCVFCMGDNRNNSTDSRDFGAVQMDHVVGKVILVVDAETNNLSFPKKSTVTTD